MARGLIGRMNKRLKEGEYMKVRVHELAKKHDIKNKEFLEILKKRYRNKCYISPI